MIRGRGKLPPVELAAQAWEVVPGGFFPVPVCPAEPRIEDGKVAHAPSLRLLKVCFPVARRRLLATVHLGGVAGVPRADDIKPAEHLGPFFTLLVPPPPLTAADECDLVLRIGLEKVDHAIGEVRAEAVAVEAEHEQDRLLV